MQQAPRPVPTSVLPPQRPGPPGNIPPHLQHYANFLQPPRPAAQQALQARAQPLPGSHPAAHAAAHGPSQLSPTSFPHDVSVQELLKRKREPQDVVSTPIWHAAHRHADQIGDLSLGLCLQAAKAWAAVTCNHFLRPITTQQHALPWHLDALSFVWIAFVKLVAPEPRYMSGPSLARGIDRCTMQGAPLQKVAHLADNGHKWQQLPQQVCASLLFAEQS